MEDKRIIINNKNNEEDVHLKNYKPNAREEVLNNISMKYVDFIKSHNSDFNHLNAINYFGKTITYKEVFEHVEEYAKAFLGYGIKEGDTVSVMLPNSPEIVYVKLALNTIGAVANLIDPRVHPNNLIKCVNNSDSKVLITILDKYKSTVEPVLDKLMVYDVFSVSPLNSIDKENIKNTHDKSARTKKLIGYYLYEYKKMLLNMRENIKNTTRFSDVSELLKYSENYTGKVDSEFKELNPATILYTSGTTGTIKGAVMSNEAYNSLYSNVNNTIISLKPGTKFCGTIPFFTSYGSGSGMFDCMCSRAEMFLYPSFTPDEFVQIIERDKPNTIITIPNHCDKLIDSGKKFDSLNQIILGGDKILTPKLTKYKTYFDGKDIIVGYGETELLGAIAVTNNDCRLDCSGIPFPSARIKIVDPETMKEVPFGKEGEVYVSNPSMMLGYLKNEEETSKITAFDIDGNKYYATGDKAFITDKGELCFVDRYKRLMKRPDCHQVNANPIEEAVMSVDGVKNCCVVGLHYKEVSGVFPTAFVQLENAALDKTTYISKFEDVSYKKLPTARDKALAYVFVDEMPLTEMGKIDHRKLSELKLDEIQDAYIVDESIKPGKVKARKK